MPKEIVVIALLLLVLLPIDIANATLFIVGGRGGWTYGVSKWQRGKTFKPGDVLVFNYPPEGDTVVIVNKKNFESCTFSGRVFSSGHDKIALAKGTTYFISGMPGHCSLGMKMAITAN